MKVSWNIFAIVPQYRILFDFGQYHYYELNWGSQCSATENFSNLSKVKFPSLHLLHKFIANNLFKSYTCKVQNQIICLFVLKKKYKISQDYYNLEIRVFVRRLVASDNFLAAFISCFLPEICIWIQFPFSAPIQSEILI